MSGNGYVALTFDDGPSATFPRLLKALTDHGLRATFFNQGNNALARPDFVRDQVAAGMWVANHSFSHPYLTQIAEQAAVEEIERTQEALAEITGSAPTLFRPPYGATSEQVRAHAARFGLAEVLWTVDSRDWDAASADEIVAAAKTVEDGGIVLLHDWPVNTIAAVPRIAEVLAKKGLACGEIAVVPRDAEGEGAPYRAVAVEPRGSAPGER